HGDCPDAAHGGRDLRRRVRGGRVPRRVRRRGRGRGTPVPVPRERVLADDRTSGAEPGWPPVAVPVMGETQTFKGKTYKNGEVPAVLLAPVEGVPGACLAVVVPCAWGRAYAVVLPVTGMRLTVRGWMRTKAVQVTFYS